MLENDQKYRLRIDDVICGYLEVKNNASFYSKDMYGWTSQPIEYSQKDKCLNLKDKKGNVLFDGDMCVKINTDEIIILYNFKGDWYEVNNLTYSCDKILPTLDYTKSLKRFDYLYAYPEKVDIIRNIKL